MTENSIQYSIPFWTDSNHDFIQSFQSHPKIFNSQLLNECNEYDIVIIGCGFSGVSCAYWLRKLYPIESFPRILLIDKNPQPCQGATGRNGGFLWPSYDYLSGYVEDFGYENGCKWVEFQVENVRSIVQTIEELKIDCDLNLERGNIALARDKQELESINKSYELLKDYVEKHPLTKISLNNIELWDYCRCQQALFSDKFIGGMFMHQSGTMWAAKFVYGLLKYCLDQSGVELITNSKVINIENSQNVILENGQRIYAKQAVVHATNAYGGEYLQFLHNKIIPTRGQCSRFKPIEKTFWQFGLSARDGREYYHQSSIDNRIVLGGCRWRSADTEHNNTNDSVINNLIRDEHDTFFSKWHPKIKLENSNFEIEQSWSGIMAFTIDHLPMIGPLPNSDKQYLLCGYNGNGMPNVFLCAKAIARMIGNEDPYEEGIQNNTITFLNMFLPSRFTNLSMM